MCSLISLLDWVALNLSLFICLIAPCLGAERTELPVGISVFILPHNQIQLPPDYLPLCISENIGMKCIIIRRIQFSS